MPVETPVKADFRGALVFSFEGPRAEELAVSIKRHNGKPVVVPTLRAVPLCGKAEAASLAKKLFEERVDVLIFLTGPGACSLLRLLETRFEPFFVREKLKEILLVARGPKTVSALRLIDVEPHRIVPEPSTWKEVLMSMDDLGGLSGKRVAVQEYGQPNLDLLKGLEERGAKVVRIPLYRWTLPKDVKPIQRAIRRAVNRKAAAVLFTNSNQVNHVFQIAREMGLFEHFQAALRRSVVASIGPLCSERLRRMGVEADVEPPKARWEDLVREAARHAALGKKDTNVRWTVKEKKTVPPHKDILSSSLFMRACRREAVERTPVWLMRQAGRYMKNYRELRSKVPMLELCKHPDLVADVTADAVARLGVDAAILFSDLLLIVEPFGLRLEYTRGEGPVVSPVIEKAADVSRLTNPRVEDALGFVAEAVRKTRAALPADIPLIGFAGAPFTLASYLIEGGATRNFMRTKLFMYSEPAAWNLLLSKLSKALISYLNMQIHSGAQAVQLFDSWVGCLSPADYEKYAMPHARRVLFGIKKGVPVIHFGTQTGQLLELMKKAGGSVIGLDWRVDLKNAWKRLGHVAVMGNLDPAVLFAPPPEIRAQVKRILYEAAGRRGHIFNLGHGILPETPFDHVRSLVETVKELGMRHGKRQ